MFEIEELKKLQFQFREKLDIFSIDQSKQLSLINATLTKGFNNINDSLNKLADLFAKINENKINKASNDFLYENQSEIITKPSFSTNFELSLNNTLTPINNKLNIDVSNPLGYNNSDSSIFPILFEDEISEKRLCSPDQLTATQDSAKSSSILTPRPTNRIVSQLNFSNINSTPNSGLYPVKNSQTNKTQSADQVKDYINQEQIKFLLRKYKSGHLFASAVMGQIFTIDELSGCNVQGKGVQKKSALDPTKVEYIRELTEKLFQDIAVKDEKFWSNCVIHMNRKIIKLTSPKFTLPKSE
ncbi:hypothetical protein BpHYR1_021802 [Brachionus plicatilis]|uniref:BEN domain-containing protein n=1 Tax=Brachionus plicatilis TaxID=10195 RepID=A0A3M7RIK6_BRAPC|nr:hypothetical protein BpHYR1_021802 [Brachionus plicatilis]